MKNKKGFTLIELLVVISIIALLLSIILPSLKNAKRLAQSVSCRANIKSLATAWFLYAEDHDGKLIGGSTYRALPENPPDWVYISPSLVNSTLGVAGGVAEMPLTDAIREPTITQGALWNYVGSLESYKCPGDVGTPYLRSYCIANTMNGHIGNWDDSAYVAQKKGEIASPANKFNFVEYDDRRVFRYGPWVCWVNKDAFVDMVALWHNKSSNFGFADGHAETHKWVDRRTYEQIEAQSFNFGSPENEDLKWLQRGYKAKSAGSRKP